MKQVRIFSMLALCISSFFTVAAQTAKKATMDQKIAARFGNTLAQLKKIEVSQPKQVEKIAQKQVIDDDLVQEALQLLLDEIDRRKMEMEKKKKEYLKDPSENGPQNIDKDLLPLLASMPYPVAGLPQAKKEMKVKYDETVFATYIEKLKRYKDQMAELARSTVPADMKNEALMKKEANANAAKAQEQLNSNPIIQQMGGLEKLQNMTPAQREALGKQMAEKMKQNPMDYTGADSDPKKAFTRKLLTDAGYKARYDHMNRQQQMEEYDFFLKENGFSNTAKGKEVDNGNGAAKAIAIDKRIAAILEHTRELTAVAVGFQKSIDEYYTGVNKKISDQYASLADALPMVEHGEAGKSKDTYPLEIANQIVLYPLNAQNAIANKETWKRYVDILKITIAEYNELLSDYWGKDKATDRLMIQRNMFPAALVHGFCDEMIGLTKMASFYSSQHAGWQKTYEGIVLHIYE